MIFQYPENEQIPEDFYHPPFGFSHLKFCLTRRMSQAQTIFVENDD
jgi:hypothetical protein